MLSKQAEISSLASTLFYAWYEDILALLLVDHDALVVLLHRQARRHTP